MQNCSFWCQNAPGDAESSKKQKLALFMHYKNNKKMIFKSENIYIIPKILSVRLV